MQSFQLRAIVTSYQISRIVVQAELKKRASDICQYFRINIIFFSLLDSDWLKSVPINP